jgi:hypothetical protein
MPLPQLCRKLSEILLCPFYALLFSNYTIETKQPTGFLSRGREALGLSKKYGNVILIEDFPQGNGVKNPHFCLRDSSLRYQETW